MSKLHWLLLGLGITAAAVAGCIAAACCRRSVRNSDDIDGGVVKRCWADAPKVIESTEITEFHGEISLLASCETDGLGHRVYRLDAVVRDGKVLVKYDWYDRQGKCDKAEYKADADFMARLQEIVAAYDFAQYNGYYHTVSGLPDMYGETLHIVYAGGERIDVHDNQSGFLPLQAEQALIMLFGAATQTETE